MDKKQLKGRKKNESNAENKCRTHKESNPNFVPQTLHTFSRLLGLETMPFASVIGLSKFNFHLKKSIEDR